MLLTYNSQFSQPSTAHIVLKCFQIFKNSMCIKYGPIPITSYKGTTQTGAKQLTFLRSITIQIQPVYKCIHFKWTS